MTEQKPRKQVIVSGASRGIGRHAALALAQAGFHVLAGVRDPADAADLAALHPENLTPVTLDITRAGDITALAGALAGQPLHGLVNNAGTAALGPLEYLPLDEIRAQFEVNLFGHIAMIQAFLPMLRAGGPGRIVNISSISGFIAFPSFSAYAASKFALEGLSDALRRELHPQGIAVSLIQPGNIDTDIWQSSFTRGRALEARLPEPGKQLYGSRFGGNADGSDGPATKSSPEDVAAAVLQAITAPHPKARYLVGKDARRFARRKSLLPDRWLDRLLR